MSKKCKTVLALVFIFCLLLSACGNEQTIPENTQKGGSSSESVPVETQQEDSSETWIQAAEAALATGDYHDAALYLLYWEEEFPEAYETEIYQDIFSVILDETAKLEPATGTELERSFQFQGGGLLSVYAESGPTEVYVEDINDSSQFVRFYVRQGETAEINLPAYVYRISVKVGITWFGDDIGFGEFYSEYEYDETFDFTSTDDGVWISNSIWELTV